MFRAGQPDRQRDQPARHAASWSSAGRREHRDDLRDLPRSVTSSWWRRAAPRSPISAPLRTRPRRSAPRSWTTTGSSPKPVSAPRRRPTTPSTSTTRASPSPRRRATTATVSSTTRRRPSTSPPSAAPPLPRTGSVASGYTEAAWSGSTSGCSAYEPKPSWQTDTGCTGRTLNDLAAVADPNTPIAYYDTPTEGGWGEGSGTVVSAAIVAASYALAGTPAAGADPASYPYESPGRLLHHPRQRLRLPRRPEQHHVRLRRHLLGQLPVHRRARLQRPHRPRVAEYRALPDHLRRDRPVPGPRHRERMPG